MRWYNLQQNKCPDCGRTLRKFSEEYFNCPNEKCHYTIKAKRFNEIVGQMNDQRRRAEYGEVEDNQEALNNF